MFNWFRRSLPSIPIHKPATSWLVKPAGWPGDHLVTPFWEDLPEKCFDCGHKTESVESDPLNIEGKIQYMKVTRLCPRGCGRTDWIA